MERPSPFREALAKLRACIDELDAASTALLELRTEMGSLPGEVLIVRPSDRKLMKAIARVKSAEAAKDVAYSRYLALRPRRSA